MVFQGTTFSDSTLSHLVKPVCFLNPDRLVSPPSWVGHIPFAFWLIDALRPATLVELGTHTGNSYAAFCQALKHLGVPAACYAVDTWAGDDQAGHYDEDVYRDFAAYHDPIYGAFSRLLRMTFDAAVDHFAEGSIELLHIDGLHTYDAVRHDFETWAPKLGRRGIVLFHDINVRRDDFGVWRLWEDLSRRHPSFTFLHSNGLGVLGLGDAPPPLQWLFAAQAENGPTLAAIRAFFDRLGAGLIDTQRAQAQAVQIADLEAIRQSLRQEVDDQVARTRDALTVVAERDGSIAHLQAGIANERRAAEALTADLHDALARVSERDHAITELRQRVTQTSAALHSALGEIDAFAGQRAALAGEIAAAQAVIAKQQTTLNFREAQINAIHASTSWRLSKPVRLAGRVAARLGGLHRSRRHRPRLTPLRDLVDLGDGTFESTGADPAFSVTFDRRRSPHGWCFVSFRVEAVGEPLRPMLYLDYGTGCDESTAIRLPETHDGRCEMLVHIAPGALNVRFDPTDHPGRFGLADFEFREIGKLQLFLEGRKRQGLGWIAQSIRRDGWAATKRQMLVEMAPAIVQPDDYATWVARYDTLSDADRDAIAQAVAAMTAPPLLSVVMPVYNPPERYLRRALDTVLAQLYPHWELCIADDASTQPHVGAVLTEYAARDPRIKVVRRARNGHISAASNSALSLATGPFVVLMDHDDELPPHALFTVAAEIDRHPDLDVIYSDEDKIDEQGRRYDPYFKSDWNPDLFHGQNMVSHLGAFRRRLLDEIGGFREGYEGSQDYDLALRAIERTTPDRIRHIPTILYHWRVFSSSSSFSTTQLETATNAARRALQDHFDRTGRDARVEPAPGAEWYSRIVYPLPDPLPRVSLLVPTRDRLDLVRQCVEGLLTETDYPDLEVIVLDNDSSEPATLDYFAELARRPRARVLRYSGAFNFSSINNFGVARATGALVGLINNDIKVIDPGWLTEMVRHALRPEVGAVGAKLYYGDDRIQHAGIVTGIGGIANHALRLSPRQHPGYFASLQLARDVSGVTAACLLTRKEVYEAVGGLDEQALTVAFNDVDFCLKVRQRGYLIVWTPFAELYHLESASRGSDLDPDKIERFKREIDCMKNRWGPALDRDPYYNPNLTLTDSDYGLAFPPRYVKPW